MKKYIVLNLVSFFVFQSYAMEVELKPCHLNRMPCDILNYIASFLMCDDETEEEFIARPRIQKEITPECKNLFDELNLECICWSFCPDETKLAAVVCVNPATLPINAIGYAHYLTIINLHGIKPEIMLQKTLSLEEYECIALSSGGNMIAFFHNKRVRSHRGENFCIEPFLEIQKILKKNENGEIVITLGEKRELSPLILKPKSIDFNKQGTDLIVHGKDADTQQAIHKIFSLKRVDPNQPQAVVKPTHKLQEYFRDKLVCQKYIEGKK